jgi:hypothetical protein
MATAQVIAIDGRPASPAMADALAKIAADGKSRRAAADAHKAMIDVDPRIISLRAKNRQPDPQSVDEVFAGMIDGGIARQHRIGSLIRARMAQLDFKGTSSEAAKRWLRDAAVTRRQQVVVTEFEPGLSGPMFSERSAA